MGAGPSARAGGSRLSYARPATGLPGVRPRRVGTAGTAPASRRPHAVRRSTRGACPPAFKPSRRGAASSARWPSPAWRHSVHCARCEKPRPLMSALGLTPSADSRGARRRQGSLTKAGHTFARRARIAGAWADRSPATVSRHLPWRVEPVTPGQPRISGGRPRCAGARRCRPRTARVTCPPGGGRDRPGHGRVDRGHRPCGAHDALNCGSSPSAAPGRRRHPQTNRTRSRRGLAPSAPA